MLRGPIRSGLRSTGDRDALEIAAMIDATLAPAGAAIGVLERGQLECGSVR